MRWRYGDTNPVIAAVAAETVVEIGDLLWQDADNAKPASMLAVSNNKPAAQAAFAAKFLGVAMARSRRCDTAGIRVATTGVFEFDCAAATFELGDLLGVDAGANGALLNQQAVKVAASIAAIGRVAKRQPTAAASALVDIRSTVMTGGVLGGGSSGS